MKDKININFVLIILPFLICAGCKSKEHDLTITVSNEVITEGFAGNGAQWDAYPEAESWGSKVSEDDWQKLYTRVDFMRPGFIRCLINSPYNYFDPSTGKYDKSRNIEPLKKLLSYCQKNNITVMFGEFNPPKWSMKQDTAWIKIASDFLNYLVDDLGFTCIRYYNLFNEPDGNWSSTDGDYEMWKEMVRKFYSCLESYPALKGNVTIAGPDIVIGYKNPSSKYEPWEWISQNAKDMDEITGIYDVHAYPGQHEVYSGDFARELKKYVSQVPAGKKIVLGEAGYKYYKPEDSLLMAEQRRRLEGHPFTKGSDCNMLVYDFFYGLDMPLLCIDIMNAGLSGMAIWMLDDAMHSNGDSGNTKDIKIWGMWNILGKEVFDSEKEEEIRPWYYSWSLMCRYFPAGADILKVNNSDSSGIRVAACIKDGKLTVAIVNVTDTDIKVKLRLPCPIENARVYNYQENEMKKDDDGVPLPVVSGVKIAERHNLEIKAKSFLLISGIN